MKKFIIGGLSLILIAILGTTAFAYAHNSEKSFMEQGAMPSFMQNMHNSMMNQGFDDALPFMEKMHADMSEEELKVMFEGMSNGDFNMEEMIPYMQDMHKNLTEEEFNKLIPFMKEAHPNLSEEDFKSMIDLHNGSYSFEEMLPYMKEMHPELNKGDFKQMYESCHGANNNQTKKVNPAETD